MILHMFRVRTHEQDAVSKLQNIEGKLELPDKASLGDRQHVFTYAVICLVIVYFFLYIKLEIVNRGYYPLARRRREGI